MVSNRYLIIREERALQMVNMWINVKVNIFPLMSFKSIIVLSTNIKIVC